MTGVGTARPGGRTARTRSAVLNATWSELLKHGYDGLSIERVADVAEVHKTTIYRRWVDRAGLVGDLVASMADDKVRVPDTGSVDEDLRLFASDLCLFMSGEGGQVVQTLSAAMSSDMTLVGKVHESLDSRYQALMPMVSRGVARGELPPGTDAWAVVRHIVAPLYFDLLVIGHKSSVRDTERSVAATLVAARAGAFSRNR